MTSAEINQKANSLEKQFPQAWPVFYPRVYQDAGNCYVSQKAPAVCLLSSAVALRLISQQKDKPPIIAEEKDVIIRALVACGMPTYYLDPSFLEAVSLRDLPEGTRWDSIGLPMPAATILLPRGALSHPLHGSVGFISYAATGIRLARVGREGTTFVACIGCCDDSSDALFDRQYMVLEPGKEVTRAGMDAMMRGMVPQHGPALFTASVLTDLETFSAHSLNLLFRVFAAIEANPWFLSEGHSTGKKLPNGREIWTPHIIGKEAKEGTPGRAREARKAGVILFGPSYLTKWDDKETNGLIQ